MAKRTFSKEEKLRIIKEAAEDGVKETLAKYDIYPASYYSWKKKFEEMGEEGFRHGITKGKLKELRRLEKENAQLKELVAEKELQIKMLRELRKKS